jgi:hypothetical protein
MPVVVGFAPPSLLLIRTTGDITYAECQRAIDQILATLGDASATCLLIEQVNVRSLPEQDDIRRLARDFVPVAARGVRHVAIVSDQAHVYGVARMFAVFAEPFGFEVRAFRKVDDAERWLRQLCDLGKSDRVEKETDRTPLER